MDVPYSLPGEDYALAILTHAAMQTTHTSETSTPSYDSITLSSGLANGDIRGGHLLITNHHSNIPQEHNRHLNLPKPSSSDMLSEYTLAIPVTGSMEPLSYTQAPGAYPSRSNGSHYHATTYHHIGAQAPQNYANNLGILNAESYDDGQHALNAQEKAEMRMKHQTELPFGITGHPSVRLDEERRSESDEQDRATKRRRRHKADDAQLVDEDEEARKKARGRPRVDTKDETAADVSSYLPLSLSPISISQSSLKKAPYLEKAIYRESFYIYHVIYMILLLTDSTQRRRTQIRMAQRAYRHRKETTITSLEKKVQDLRGTNEEMSNIFISLYDFAVGKGLLQREPEFGQHLQSTTERFLALAKSINDDDGSVEEPQPEEPLKQDDPDPVRQTKSSRRSTKKRLDTAPESAEPIVQPWGGYTVSKEDNSVGTLQPNFHQQTLEDRTRAGDHQIITRPTVENASFPFEFTNLQQYRVEVPSIDDFSHNFLPYSQPPAPSTLSHSEFSFARRIQRGALERAVKLLSLEYPPPKRFQEVFGFSLMYMNKDDLLVRMKALLASSSKESLQAWRNPFVHTGGSGTFYPTHDSSINGDLMPQFRTGFSMGPFSRRVSEVQELIQDDLRCTIPGFEGDFFDPNDVEGYLRGHGLNIPPAADFVTAEIDISEITNPTSFSSSESGLSSLSPKTPQSPDDHVLHTNRTYTSNYNHRKPDGNAFPFPIGFANWESNTMMKEGSNLNPIFNTTPTPIMKVASVEPTTSERPPGERRLVTINVKVLLDGEQHLGLFV